MWRGPWGSRRIAEGLGVGALTHGIAKTRGHKPSARATREVIQLLLETIVPDEFQVNLDAETITGAVLNLETTAIPLIGPNLLLAANADPSDRAFEICTLQADQQDKFSKWLTDPKGGDVPAPISVRTVHHLTILGRFQKVRLNDDLWTNEIASRDCEISLETQARPIRFLLPNS